MNENINQTKRNVSTPTRLPSPDSIKPKSTDNLCELKFIKTKDGLWKIETTDYPLGYKDKNEILRQFKLWFGRYTRKNHLDNIRKQRLASEKAEQDARN